MSAAVIFPSLVAPSFTFIQVPGAGPDASKTSVRLISNFTGRPDFFDNKAAMGSR